jgi:putative phosphoesterase
MITFLVISDSHGDVANIKRAVNAVGRFDGIIFLGDGIRDIDYIKDSVNLPIYAVLGNCDHFSALSDYKKVECLTFEGRRIVITHGDLYGAKYGDGGLLLLAREYNADVVLHGHTHFARSTYEDGVYLCNPGSIASSFEGASFGVLTLKDGNALFSFKKID